MMKFSVVCLYFVVVAVNFWNVKCLTKEEEKEIGKVMKPIADECMSYCNLKEDDFKEYKEGGDMDPCFKKCILQKMGFLNQEGKYDPEGLHDALNEYGDETDKAQKVEEQMNECFKANGDNDGDDEEAQMKRVNVVFDCMKEIKVAVTDAQKSEIQRELVTVGLKCIKDHPLSLSDIRAFKNKMIPNGNDPKCFVACLFKKIGVMDDMGMISPAKAKENAKKVFKGSDEHLKNVDEIMEKCAAGN
ncbi:hypothetical protein PYW08_011738 [Mythimna loreyi]|uniref:Uncharacterized protein n=1 Tax=Mythimna loreyi TaxID=667449 RepID=A0ACC2QMW3_9NEOP|nr:hypothetical protein PYW08_011738 [Mythimna loreyi]